ncbi:MAG: VanZ family protein [Saprospiraceae bacterium]|nr:VanZ family protein [Saprospiraceae bacterium]
MLPALLWSGVIAWLSTGPGVSVPEDWRDLLAWDKLGHLTAYGIQTWLLLWGTHKIGIDRPLGVVAASAIFGIAMETIQFAFFPNRYFEVLDIIANIIGSLLAFWIFRNFYH